MESPDNLRGVDAGVRPDGGAPDANGGVKVTTSVRGETGGCQRGGQAVDKICVAKYRWRRDLQGGGCKPVLPGKDATTTDAAGGTAVKEARCKKIRSHGRLLS